MSDDNLIGHLLRKDGTGAKPSSPKGDAEGGSDLLRSYNWHQLTTLG